MFNGNPSSGKSGVKRLLFFGQRVFFRRLKRNYGIGQVFVYTLVPAVRQGLNAFRQNTRKAFFEYPEVVYRTQTFSEVMYKV